VLVFWLNRESFLDEFRRRAPDFWDWRGKVAMFEVRPPLNPLLYPYLEWLIAENSYLKMSGVMQVNRQVDIFLDQIYVSLQAEWVEERSQSFRERVTTGKWQFIASHGSSNKLGEPDASEVGLKDELIILDACSEPVSRHRVTKIVDLAEAVRKQDYSVILGDPGAGKTTLLRYLARHFAIAHRDSKPTVLGGMQEDLGQVRLPILFRIADYAERLAKQPDLSLVDYLKQFYRQWERYFEASNGDAVANLLLDKMAAGDCLLLLDGLDEVFDQSNRVQVVQQINRLVNDYRTNKFVITSRIAGYQEAELGNRFREFTITPMGNTQIQQFLERWCLAIEVAQRPDADTSLHQRDAAREAQGILHAIETKPGVKRFAANPLLLTILALIHRNGTQMPQRRVELYALATKTLIEDWQLGRNAPYGARQRQLILVEEEVTALLAPLAFRMHEEKPSGLVTQAEVEEWLTPKMAELQGVDEPAALELVRQFLRKVRETTGLFVERAPAVYGFMHLTFEEYFAARHIADNEIDDILRIISPYRNQARWNEPILLALGYLSADQKRVNRLVEQLFSNLAAYQPLIAGKEIRLKNASADHPVLVWYSQPEGQVQESDSVWQDLLFVGQVLAEVKVTPKLCRQQVEKLVLTYLGIDTDFNDEPTQQLLRLLRGIETFNHQVLERLQQAAEDECLSEEQHNRALVAMLYVVFGEAGETLTDCVMAIVQQLTPSLFDEIRNLVAQLGAEMTPALERGLEDKNLDAKHLQALEFITGLSYLRAEHYDCAIDRLQLLVDQADCHLEVFIHWAIAIAYEKKDDYDQGLQYYQQCSEKLQSGSDSAESLILWRNWGWCYRLHKQYEQSFECFQQALAISRQSKNRKEEANILWNIGRSYQDWGKYEEAVAYHKQSRELYEQLGKETNVANQWNWLSACYREWGKYEQALEAQQQELTLRQRLDDQSNIAEVYWRLGRIYQAWGKYKEVLTYYQQSRDLYQQLGKQSSVADLWYWIGDGYREWGKYEQALEAQQQELTIRQRLDEQAKIARAYSRLGRIYQAWGKYEQAIAHYQQSRDLYQQLGKETNVANQWYWMAVCYRKWGKYQQALEAQQQELTLRKRLDDQPNIADAYYQLGRIYQAWGKYEQALAHYQQSRDLNQQLGKETNVANQWYWIGDCYREWGKYEQALEAQQQDLTLRQRINEQSNIARAYYQLGRTYQAWGKYKQAIAHYQQSRDLLQQLERPKDVMTLWAYLTDSYQEWGKYQQALECQQHCFEIRQTLDDSSLIAVSYYQLGRIYQAWGKYEQAIAHHQQSRDLYQQLEQPKDVASRWYNLADCYRQWGKYEQALECQQHCLEIRQTLNDLSLIALSYYQLGRIYQAWGKYELALTHYQQSRELYQQLGKETDVANLWYWIGHCYKQQGKYELAIECQQQCLELRRLEEEQSRVALSLDQLGGIYQAWDKYAEAIAHHEQSRDLYATLDLQQKVANQLSSLAACYRESKDYIIAIEYYQNSFERHQALGHNESAAKRLRQLSNTQRLLAKNCSREEATALLQQAEYHLQQAIQLDTAGDYRENLAYDHIALALLSAEHLRWLPKDDASVPDRIAQFEQSYTTGFACLTELGQTVDNAKEALDIARAYLEISLLENLDRAEALAHQSLQTFQDFNRRKLEASACKLLGEIYLARAHRQESGAIATASQFLTTSLHLYRELDLTEKAAEVEQLMTIISNSEEVRVPG
jgi:tetratricopeptide (TPR) repeat protein